MKNMQSAAAVSQRDGSAETKITRRQIQAMETRDKIYRTAIAIINEKGFNNVSIEDITSAANVARGSFYTHFESKEALILYNFTQSDKVYADAYQKVQDEPFGSMILDFVRLSYTEYEKRGKGIIKAMVANYFSFPDYNLYSKDRKLLQCLAKIIEKGKQDQLLDASVDTDRYVSRLLSVMIGVEVMWCFDEEGQSLADMMQEEIRIVTKGMLVG